MENEEYLKKRIEELEKANLVLQDELENLKLKHSLTEDIYFHFFNTLKDFFWILDETGNIIFVNDYVTERLGYSREELYEMNVLAVHPIERRDEAAKIVGEMLQGTAEFCPIPILSKQGHAIAVETRVVLGNWNNKPVIFGISKDISALRLSEEKFSKAFHLNTQSTAISEYETGKYIEVNEGFLETFGLTRAEVIGKTSIDINILNIETRNLIKEKYEKDGFLKEHEVEIN